MRADTQLDSITKLDLFVGMIVMGVDGALEFWVCFGGCPLEVSCRKLSGSVLFSTVLACGTPTLSLDILDQEATSYA